jgi:hypothetical protein
MSDATGPPTTSQGESSGAQEKAGQVAGQAREGVQEAAGQAQEKTKEAAARAQDMIHEQVDQRSTQAGERVSGAAGDLRSVGEELHKQGKDAPAKLADRAAERTERVGSYLREADSDRLLSDAEDFGRRQPLAVLAGGLVVGIAAARFLKASSRGRYQSRLGSESATREPRATASSQPSIPAEPAAPGQPAPAGVPVTAEPVAGR